MAKNKSKNKSKKKETVFVVVTALLLISALGIFATIGPAGILNPNLNASTNFVILDIPRIITHIDSASTGISHHAEADFSVMISGSRRSNLDVEKIRYIIEESLSGVEHDELRASGDIDILSRIAHEALIREFPDSNIDRVLVRGFVFYFRLPGNGR